MSYTLLVWGSPVPANIKEAGALIQRSPLTAFDATPALARYRYVGGLPGFVRPRIGESLYVKTL